MSQEPTLHDLQERIAHLEEMVNQLTEAVSSGDKPQGLSRRQLLALAGSGAVAIAVGSAGTTKLLVNEATAQQVAEGEVGTDSNPLEAIHVENWYADQETLELTQLDVDDLRAKSGGVINLGGTDLNNVGTLSTEKIDTDADGNGYSWQNVTSSRSYDTWFTAPSDRDIWFVATAQAQSDGITVALRPNVNTSQTNNEINTNNKLSAATNARVITGQIRVPAGQDYRVEALGDTVDYNLDEWRELR